MFPSHVVSYRQFMDTGLIEEILASAGEMEAKAAQGALPQSLRGKLVATLFYEPSTRTRFSFEAAVQRLGGSVISSECAAMFSSSTKGESLPDTVRIVGAYADGIVLRHTNQGAAEVASQHSPVPVVNAGDGAGEHPTQALLDLYAIRKEIGRLEELRITVVGDLLYGRTVHSLLPLFSLYPGTRLQLVAPEQLRLPAKQKEMLEQRGCSVEESDRLEPFLAATDILYVTRIQKERFPSEADYEKLKGSYCITQETLDKLPKSAAVLHPLPRVGEIAPEIDADPRAAYFRQAAGGLFVRMAVLDRLLGSL